MGSQTSRFMAGLVSGPVQQEGGWGREGGWRGPRLAAVETPPLGSLHCGTCVSRVSSCRAELIMGDNVSRVTWNICSLPTITLVARSLPLAGELRGLIACVSDLSITTRQTRQSAVRSTLAGSRFPATLGSRKGPGPGGMVPYPSPSRLCVKGHFPLSQRAKRMLLHSDRLVSETEQTLEMTSDALESLVAECPSLPLPREVFVSS